MNTVPCRGCRRPLDPESAFCPACGVMQTTFKPRGVRQGMSTGDKVWVGIAGVVGVLMVAGFMLVAVAPKPRPDAPEAKIAPTVEPGSEAVLELPGGHGVFAALDEAAWDPMTQAISRNDSEELEILVGKGKVAYLSNRTRAKAIDRTFTSWKIRIRNGLWEGKEGWVHKEYVRARRDGDLP